MRNLEILKKKHQGSVRSTARYIFIEEETDALCRNGDDLSPRRPRRPDLMPLSLRNRAGNEA